MTVAENEPPIFSTVGSAEARLGEQDASAASRALAADVVASISPP